MLIRCWGRLSRRLIVGAGEWMSGAGDVVLPPSGWDDDMVPVVGDDDE